MAILLFSLRDVPDDENFEIKELLDAHKIYYYETSAGNWGVSMPALWLKDKEQLEQAQKLLSEYHTQRALSQKKIYQELKNKKQNKRLLDVIIENPFKFVLYLATIAFIIYLYPKMLFEFGL